MAQHIQVAHTEKLILGMTRTRFLTIIAGMLILIGVLLPWFNYGLPLIHRSWSYAGVEMGIFGTALLMLVILLMITIIFNRPRWSILFGFMILIISLAVLFKLKDVYYYTFYYFNETTMWPYPSPLPGPGLILTLIGAIILCLNGLLFLKRKKRRVFRARHPEESTT